ncbi:MAG: helicase RepA family protein [Clostridia bacterium]|nr:helicase RepA family protein [Clostridia bacterium]
MSQYLTNSEKARMLEESGVDKMLLEQHQAQTRKPWDAADGALLYATPLPDIHFVVEDLLPQGLAILAAQPKYGKSYMALDLCIKVAAGKPFLGMQTNACHTMYLALEDSHRRLKKRMGQLIGEGEVPTGFQYTTRSDTMAENLLWQMEDYLQRNPECKLIVIDTLQRVRGLAGKTETTYGSDYRELGALKAIADKKQICVLLIHHLRKMPDSDDVFNRISGTNGIMGVCDTGLVLWRDNRADELTNLSITGRDVDTETYILKKEGFHWAMAGTTQQMQEQITEQEYLNSPITALIKGLVAREKLQDKGYWEGTATELQKEGQPYDEYFLNATPQELSAALKRLRPQLLHHDNIMYDRRKYNGKTHLHRFFYLTQAPEDDGFYMD